MTISNGYPERGVASSSSTPSSGRPPSSRLQLVLRRAVDESRGITKLRVYCLLGGCSEGAASRNGVGGGAISRHRPRSLKVGERWRHASLQVRGWVLVRRKGLVENASRSRHDRPPARAEA